MDFLVLCKTFYTQNALRQKSSFKPNLKKLLLGIKCFQGLDRQMDSLKNILPSAAVIVSTVLVKDCAQ